MSANRGGTRRELNVTLLAPVAGEGGGHAEADEYAAGVSSSTIAATAKTPIDVAFGMTMSMRRGSVCMKAASP
jgi:hypothetical protein